MSGCWHRGKRMPVAILLSAIFLVSALTFILAKVSFPRDVERFAVANDPYVDATLSRFVDDGYLVSYRMKRSGFRSWVLDGPFSVRFPDGTRFVQGQYLNGVWDGALLSWDEAGQLASIEYYDKGKQSGVAVFLEERRLSRWVHYLDGEKDGPEVYLSNMVQLGKVVDWEQGHPVSLRMYENGVVVTTLVGRALHDYFVEQMRYAEEAMGVTPPESTIE